MAHNRHQPPGDSITQLAIAIEPYEQLLKALDNLKLALSERAGCSGQAGTVFAAASTYDQESILRTARIQKQTQYVAAIKERAYKDTEDASRDQFQYGVLLDNNKVPSYWAKPNDSERNTQAIAWYKKAAKRGHKEAQLRLAKKYEKGHVKNTSSLAALQEAARLYRLASALNNSKRGAERYKAMCQFPYNKHPGIIANIPTFFLMATLQWQLTDVINLYKHGKAITTMSTDIRQWDTKLIKFLVFAKNNENRLALLPDNRQDFTRLMTRLKANDYGDQNSVYQACIQECIQARIDRPSRCRKGLFDAAKTTEAGTYGALLDTSVDSNAAPAIARTRELCSKTKKETTETAVEMQRMGTAN
jgi:hypothetical protein